MRNLVRTNFSRHEHRRDRRYVSQSITVTIAGHEYAVADWSLGGFQPVAALQVAVGEQVTGAVTIRGRDKTYDFTAAAVRRDVTRNGIGFCFVAPSPSLIDALDRALAARFAGKR